MDPCRHPDVLDGRCTTCGACTHEVVLNGACFFCGATDIDVTVRPVEPALVPAGRLVRGPRGGDS
ncbi:MAG TPA: hypothetical protein VK698_38965 [Kofleriaceae bacterium]|nr:hypothetical protein [Kofleriaceae bacterium]